MKNFRLKLIPAFTLLVLAMLSVFAFSYVKFPPSGIYVMQKRNPRVISYYPPVERIKDMFYSSYYDYGSGHIIDNEKLRVGGWGDEYWTLLQFDLSGLPKHADNVEVILWSYDEEGTSTGMEVSTVTIPWDEIHGWYIELKSDYLTTMDAPPREGIFRLDITDLYNSWQSGKQPNYGVVFKPVGVDHQFNTFYSSEYKESRIKRPSLLITIN